jgi:dUTP pyrophosphatase
MIPARGIGTIETDIAIHLPPGCYGRIAPRADLAIHRFIGVCAGVIDEDYRGNVCAILFNHADIPYLVRRGDPIALLICQNILYPELEEVQELDVRTWLWGIRVDGT